MKQAESSSDEYLTCCLINYMSKINLKKEKKCAACKTKFTSVYFLIPPILLHFPNYQSYQRFRELIILLTNTVIIFKIPFITIGVVMSSFSYMNWSRSTIQCLQCFVLFPDLFNSIYVHIINSSVSLLGINAHYL